MNAYSEGSVVHLDAAISPGNSFRFFKDVNGQPTDPAEGLGTITRLSFDLSDTNDNVTRTVFHGAMGEMPRIDDRFAMSRYRYGFTKTPGGIAMIDWETMSRRVHSTLPGAPGGGQEPVFVPRSPDAAEGDGYVLCVLNRIENRADLVILDTRNFEGPPQAVVRLPFNEPMSFHGGFASAADKRAGATARV
jgi:carotenoid cleavage dioxygenase